MGAAPRVGRSAAVDDENQRHLDALPGDATIFAARDVFKGGEPGADARAKLLDAVEKKSVGALRLKKGAQVAERPRSPPISVAPAADAALLQHCVPDPLPMCPPRPTP